MDFSPLRKSFKSRGSGFNENNNNEEQPILTRHQRLDDSEDCSRSSPKVPVKQEASTGISSSDNRDKPPWQKDMEDPPSKLIGQFLNKQKIAGGEISLDMDMDMDELRTDNTDSIPGTPLNSSNPSREIRVSFDPSVSGGIDGSTDSVRRRYKDLPETKDNSADNTNYYNNNNNSDYSQQQQQRREEVLLCSSNASFRAQSKISILKSKSRILDPLPEELERMSSRLPPRSGQLKSGKGTEDDDEDPLEGEGLPQEYMRGSLNTFTVLQLVGLIAIIAGLICSLAIPSLREENFLQLKLWKWAGLLLVLISGRLVSGWGIRIIVFFIERNFLLRKRVLYFVYGLKSGVQNCWWLGLVLLAWRFLFDGKVKREGKVDFLTYVTKILVCLLVANVIWLIKTLMVKVLASSFHVSTYFDRIQESIFNQYVIETLSGPPWIEIQRNDEEEAAEFHRLQTAGFAIPPELRQSGSSQGMHKSLRMKSLRFSKEFSRERDKKIDNGIRIDHLHKLNHKNVSAWNMKRLMNIVRHGSLSTLDEQILGATTRDDDGTEIRSEQEAKLAARKIFYNVARHGSKYIYFQDLLRFLNEDEALKTMSFFEGASESSKISKTSLKNWVVNAFRERRALALTLNDTKTAVNKLHHVVNMIVSVIILVIWLVILGIATSKFVVFMGSQILVVSFIFGNTAKTLFESIIFLFFIHPFDVGDRCEVDGEQMIVEEMNILTTIFLRGDNLKIVFPNNVLATKPIGNFYRSPEMGDAVEFFIHISTPPEKIALMKQRITSYIDCKKEHWYPNPLVVMMELEDLKKVRVAVWMRHRINHQDMGERYIRRSQLVEEMVKIFKDIDIPLEIKHT